MNIKQMNRFRDMEKSVARAKAALVASWIAQPLVSAAVAAVTVWLMTR